MASLKAENDFLYSRCRPEPIPAVLLRAPSANLSSSTAPSSARYSPSPRPSFASARAPASGGGSERAWAQLARSREATPRPSSGRRLASPGPPAAPSWLQSLVPQSGPADQPVALPWGSFF